MAWILEWSGFKNDDRPTTLLKTSWDTSGNEARKHTLLIKIVFYLLQFLELLLKEPVPAVSPPLNWGGGGTGVGKIKCVIFTSCCVIVPRVLTRVVAI